MSNIVLTYHWQYLPTGETGMRAGSWASLEDAYRTINDWNGTISQWKYWV